MYLAWLHVLIALVHHGLRTQGGRYKKAAELCVKAIDIEEKTLGARRHKMAMLYHLQGLVKDDVGSLL